MRHDIADHRKEYKRGELLESNAAADPYALFGTWLDDAEGSGQTEPTGMVLATADKQGRPSARVVLLKGVDAAGFRFYTNYESRKGRELLENPVGALVFWWEALERQVRAEGPVRPLSGDASDRYYASRPLGSRLGAWASPQSRQVDSREELEGRLKEVSARFAEEPPPRPPYWGGFVLDSEVMEFWQGRPSRLHDRLRYRRDPEGGWRLDRLAP